MNNRKYLIKVPALLRCFSGLGLFNSLILWGGVGLYFVWFFVFSRQRLDFCSCGPFAGFLFLPELFPEEMSLRYALNWVFAFFAAMTLEFLIITGFILKASLTKTRLLLIPLLWFLAFVHNLPGAFLVLTLMSQPAYFLYYLMATLLSLPLLLVYRPLCDFRKTESEINKQVFWQQPMWGLSRFALLYLVLNVFFAPLILMLPALALVEWRFLFHPLHFFLLLWGYQFIQRKRAIKKLRCIFQRGYAFAKLLKIYFNRVKKALRI